MSDSSLINSAEVQTKSTTELTPLQWAHLYAIALIESGIDVTETYDDWIRIGLALASLGEDGRKIFHLVSSLHPRYDQSEADAKFTDLLSKNKQKISLRTFIKYCTDAGIKLNRTHFEKLGLSSFNGKSVAQNSKPNKSPSKSKNPETSEDKWLFNVPDILNAPDQETLWAFFTKGVNNALVASSEAGKSTLVLLLAMYIALEAEFFLGWPLNTPKGRCIYVSTEDGISQIKNRLNLMLKNTRIPDNGILFILDAHDLINRVEQVLLKTPADFLFIDTWGDLVGGKYDGELTRQKMMEIKQVCIKYDCTPVYIHHTNKASENIPDKGSIKGAGDFEQACRVVIMLSIFEEHRWLCCVKGNPFAEDLKNECHQLKFDAETHSIQKTGFTISRIDLVAKLKADAMGRKEKSIDWQKLLNGKKLTRAALAKLVMKVYGLQKSQAYDRINSAQLNQDSDENFYL